MPYLFSYLSKYVLALFILAYSVLSLTVFAAKNGKSKSVISGFQNMINISVIFISFTDMYIVSKSIIYLFLMILILLGIVLILSLTGGLFKEADRLLLNNYCMLVSSGLIIIARISGKKAVKQFAIIIGVFCLCLLLLYLFEKIKFLKKITWWYYGIGIVMLLSVFVLGKITHGSNLSVTIGSVTFQPSEFVKIIFIFFIAALLWNRTDLRTIIISAAATAVLVLIQVISKDLGSALIFFITYLLILTIATGKIRYLFIGSGLFIPACAAAYFIFYHIRVRFLIWLNPWDYIDNKGYQITQSLFSITSGGLFGTGLLKGTPETIPYAETDFIFSVICEELGIIFAISLLLISISSFLEMFRISRKINDNFYKLVITGIAVSLTFQVFLTVGGGVKFIPLTGVTFPLVSYGGSSVMASTIMYYLVQAVYIRLRHENSNSVNNSINNSMNNTINSSINNNTINKAKPANSFDGNIVN